MCSRLTHQITSRGPPYNIVHLSVLLISTSPASTALEPFDNYYDRCQTKIILILRKAIGINTGIALGY